MHPQLHPLFVDFCTYFNGNQDYFECHEVLEEHWKTIASANKTHVLVGLIQVATGLYHWRRENFLGAHRLLQKAQKNLLANEDTPFLAAFDKTRLLHEVEIAIVLTSTNVTFQAFSLPIIDEALLSQVQQAIAELPVQDENYLLHKHTLRDRSDILEEREAKRRSRR